VERAAEVDDLVAALAAPGGEVLPHLPVEGGLKGVLDGQRAAVDEEIVDEAGQPGHFVERADERGVQRRVDVGVGDLGEGRGEQALPEGRIVATGMVIADRLGGEEAVEIEEALARERVTQVAAAARFEVHDDVEAVDQQTPA